MEQSNQLPNIDIDNKVMDLCPDVVSFQTNMGSVYTKQGNGRFARHKYDGHDYEPMEWTLFTDREGDKDLQMAKIKMEIAQRTGVKVFFMIIEYDEGGVGRKMISHPDEIDNIHGEFDLLTYQTDGNAEPELFLQTPITFTPKIGYSVFEFCNNGAQYHHGDVVSNITNTDSNIDV